MLFTEASYEDVHPDYRLGANLACEYSQAYNALPLQCVTFSEDESMFKLLTQHRASWEQATSHSGFTITDTLIREEASEELVESLAHQGLLTNGCDYRDCEATAVFCRKSSRSYSSRASNLLLPQTPDSEIPRDLSGRSSSAAMLLRNLSLLTTIPVCKDAISEIEVDGTWVCSR